MKVFNVVNENMLLTDISWGMAGSGKINGSIDDAFFNDGTDVGLGDALSSSKLSEKVYTTCDWYLFAVFTDRVNDEMFDEMFLDDDGFPPVRIMKFSKDTTLREMMIEIASDYRCGIFDGIEEISRGVFKLVWGY